IYFKGDWQFRFDKKLTRDEQFLLAADNKVNIPMMHQTGDFNYLRDNSLEAVELPYAGKELSMVIFVPTKLDAMTEFEKNWTAENRGQFMSELQPVKSLPVVLPRFKMTKDYQLKKVLPNMGMSDAFVGGVADFSGISPVAKRDGWFIHEVIHKAFVEV